MIAHASVMSRSANTQANSGLWWINFPPQTASSRQRTPIADASNTLPTLPKRR